MPRAKKETDMLQPVELSITKNAEQITQIAHALSSPARMEILKLLTYKNLTIKQIADEIKQPLNTTLNHINLLEQAGLLATQISYTSKGKSKTCYRMLDSVNILLFDPSMDLPQLKYEEYQLPIGSFFDFFRSCRAVRPCVGNTWARQRQRSFGISVTGTRRGFPDMVYARAFGIQSAVAAETIFKKSDGH